MLFMPFNLDLALNVMFWHEMNKNFQIELTDHVHAKHELAQLFISHCNRKKVLLRHATREFLRNGCLMISYSTVRWNHFGKPAALSTSAKEELREQRTDLGKMGQTKDSSTTGMWKCETVCQRHVTRTRNQDKVSNQNLSSCCGRKALAAPNLFCHNVVPVSALSDPSP